MHLKILFGIWRATLFLPDAELPFQFEMQPGFLQDKMIIYNGDERIEVDELQMDGDSFYIKLPVFDSEIRVKLDSNQMTGSWINYARKGNPAIPFHAAYGVNDRFIATAPPAFNVAGRWETTMEAGTSDSSLAIGVFTQEGNKVKGTFLAAGGDHRYLDGIVSGDTLWLSTFDGSHCWLYRGIKKGNQLLGTYWSGNHYKSEWIATRNDTIQLPDPLSIASVSHNIDFSFPDADSNFISINNKKFRNKVVLLQIMGSWCPNCLDETAFLSGYYKKNKGRGLEIIGLTFEKTTDFRQISTNIKRLKARYMVDYPVLYAGSVGREEVMKKLPGLENFKSYPTTIYIDKKGKIVKVHSGFSGPATGEEYTKFVEGFKETMDKLLEH